MPGNGSRGSEPVLLADTADDAGSVRHLFYVHSNLAYLCALAIMSQERLAHERCAIVLARKVDYPASPVRCTRLTEPGSDLFMDSLRSYARVLRNRKALRAADRRIARLTNDRPFVAHLPHPRPIVCQLLKSHPHCLGFTLFEEGVGSITDRALVGVSNDLIPARITGQFLSFGRRSSPVPRPADFDFLKVYALTPEAYAGFPRRVQLEIGDIADPSIDVAVDGFSGACILVVDAFVEAGYTDAQSYATAIGRGLQRLLRARPDGDAQRFFVKFHPEQLDEVQQRILEELDRRFGRRSYQVLRDDVIVEVILLRAENVTVLCASSTLGWYAMLWGQSAYTMNDELAQLDGSFLERLQRLDAAAVLVASKLPSTTGL